MFGLPPNLRIVLRRQSRLGTRPMSLGNFIIRLCDGEFGCIEAVRRWLGRPEVKTVSTHELQSLIHASAEPPVLVDVRSQAEQAVSKIPGAITQQEYEASAANGPDRQVVVYCTVGGRSYLYTRRLVAAGIEASNYREGILGWCRAGLPLETADHQPTNAVHPYWRAFAVPEHYEVRM